MSFQTLKRIMRYIRSRIVMVVLALVTAAIGVGLSLWVPVLIGQAVDTIVGAGQVDFNAMTPILIKIAIAIVGSSISTYIMTRLTNVVSYSVVKDMRRDAFNKLQRVPLSYIDSKAHGDLISRLVNDIDQVSDGLLQGFTQLFTSVATIVGTLLFMLSINKSISLVVVLITPISFLVASFIARNSFRIIKKQMQQRGEIGGYAEELISGHSVVRLFNYGAHAQETFEKMNDELYQSGVKSQFYSSLTNPSTRFVNALVYAAVGVVGAFSAIAGTITIGQISSFLMYAGQYTKPFNEISGVITELQTAVASAARIFEIIDHPEERADSADAIARKGSLGEVTMQHVDFSYNKEVPLIKDLNLHANSGQTIAIVGPTGAGKSTLINLLMRFYDIDAGHIYIDRDNLYQIKRDDLRSLFGMVLQESWLFTGTVWENIAFGRPDATESEVIEAAKKASADGFIRRLPEGYHTVLTGEDGGISQGQKQLLCIARVMLTDPPMLILDEATSNIDTRTEAMVQHAFSEMMDGRTSFVVAHRLSTIRKADLILVMQEGSIIEQGTHAELLDQKGFYASLYSSQFEQR